MKRLRSEAHEELPLLKRLESTGSFHLQVFYLVSHICLRVKMNSESLEKCFQSSRRETKKERKMRLHLRVKTTFIWIKETELDLFK